MSKSGQVLDVSELSELDDDCFGFCCKLWMDLLGLW